MNLGQKQPTVQIERRVEFCRFSISLPPVRIRTLLLGQCMSSGQSEEFCRAPFLSSYCLDHK